MRVDIGNNSEAIFKAMAFIFEGWFTIISYNIFLAVFFFELKSKGSLLCIEWLYAAKNRWIVSFKAILPSTLVNQVVSDLF